MTEPRTLLWTDDEGPGRFEYAARRLTREGWELVWARSVSDAADVLRSRPVSALVLDQMLPLGSDTSESTVWGGCALFCWLRGRPVPVGVPGNVALPAGGPLPGNAGAPVVIVSAYRHDDVEAAILDAAGASPLSWVGKPLDLDAVRRAIGGGGR